MSSVRFTGPVHFYRSELGLMNLSLVSAHVEGEANRPWIESESSTFWDHVSEVLARFHTSWNAPGLMYCALAHSEVSLSTV